MVRSLVFTFAMLGASVTSVAPMQCGSGSDRPHEDSAGDALYKLSQDFKAKGNEQASKDTLRYLVEHYPSNRHVPAAREELGMAGSSEPPPAAASASSSSSSSSTK